MDTVINLDVLKKHSGELIKINEKTVKTNYDERTELLYQNKQIIVSAINDIKNSFIKIGSALWKIDRGNMATYLMIGQHACYNVYDYALRMFGLKKTSVKNLIGVFETFGIATGEYVKPEFEGYSYTQLVEMLPLDESERKQISSDMKISEIRELKQKLLPAEDKKSGQLTDQTKNASDQIENQIEIAPQDLEVIQAEELKPCAGLKFKNDTERGKWIEDYRKNCYLWVDVPPLGIQVYRYDFINDVSLIVTEFASRISAHGVFNCQLITSEPDKFKHDYSVRRDFGFSTLTINQVVDWLKTNRAVI